MKCRSFFVASLLMMTALQTAFAQKMTVNLANGKTVVYRVSQVESVTFEEGDPSNFEFVDLGLPSGTLWATCNIGANTPDDYGDLFAWGETKSDTELGKFNYAWSTYQLCNGSASTLTKYNTVDGKTVLEAVDDAATAIWGSNWQTPSKEQFEELLNSSYTTTVWTTYNGVFGRLFISNVNSKSIFLPAAGTFIYLKKYYDGGYYHTRTLKASNPQQAYYLLFNNEGRLVVNSDGDRCFGLSIRPVVKSHEYVDLGLPSGTLWATCNLGADAPEEYGDYFAWGETETKDTYTWGAYQWMNEGKSSWTQVNKYTFADGQTSGCWYSNGSFIGDNKIVLVSADDAATANWGDGWRMPSKDQFEELINTNYTTVRWTTQNGVNGRLITSKTNGKSIFLPAAGRYDGTNLSKAGTEGYYWSRSLSDSYSDCGYYLYIQSGTFYTHGSDRCRGQSIRPVRK